jgi:hypothetical protein
MKSSHGEKKTVRGPNKPKKKRLLAPRVESTTFCKTETDALIPDHQIQAIQVTQLFSLQLFIIYRISPKFTGSDCLIFQ